jgi:hypothetical protein
LQDFETDNLGGLMSVIVANAYNTEEARGSLGLLNWLGDKVLHMAHLRRANTIEGRNPACCVSALASLYWFTTDTAGHCY